MRLLALFACTALISACGNNIDGYYSIDGPAGSENEINLFHFDTDKEIVELFTGTTNRRAKHNYLLLSLSTTEKENSYLIEPQKALYDIDDKGPGAGKIIVNDKGQLLLHDSDNPKVPPLLLKPVSIKEPFPILDENTFLTTRKDNKTVKVSRNNEGKLRIEVMKNAVTALEATVVPYTVGPHMIAYLPDEKDGLWFTKEPGTTTVYCQNCEIKAGMPTTWEVKSR